MANIAWYKSPEVMEFIKQITGTDGRYIRRVIVDITMNGAVMVYVEKLADAGGFDISLPAEMLEIKEIQELQETREAKNG